MKKGNCKTKLHIIILYIIIVLSTVSDIILNKNTVLANKMQILKNMDETTEVTNLNKSIETLNASHEEYANYIETTKAQIASAITEKGVITSADEKLETMASNIKNISSNKTQVLFDFWKSDAWDSSWTDASEGIESVVEFDGTLYLLLAAWCNDVTLTINDVTPTVDNDTYREYTHSTKFYKYYIGDVKKDDVIKVKISSSGSTMLSIMGIVSQ